MTMKDVTSIVDKRAKKLSKDKNLLVKVIIEDKGFEPVTLCIDKAPTIKEAIFKFTGHYITARRLGKTKVGGGKKKEGGV